LLDSISNTCSILHEGVQLSLADVSVSVSISVTETARSSPAGDERTQSNVSILGHNRENRHFEFILHEGVQLFLADVSVSVSIGVMETTRRSPAREERTQVLESFLELFLAQKAVAVFVVLFEDAL
ncbi:hypothetical protein RJ640_020257, partial [Escallonia rubra]